MPSEINEQEDINTKIKRNYLTIAFSNINATWKWTNL
jgi:hypothetical protein